MSVGSNIVVKGPFKYQHILTKSPPVYKPDARKSYSLWVESPRIGYPTRVGYSRCSNRALIAHFTRWPFPCSSVHKTSRIESNGTEQINGKQV